MRAGVAGGVHLDADALVGRGLHRACYVHPHAPDRCIKVLTAAHRQASYAVEQRREVAAYRRHAARGNSWRHLARYYGEVATDAGAGAVFELIRDDDGGVSKTLQFYLAAPADAFDGDGDGDGDGVDVDATVDELARAVKTLYTGMLDERIITMNLKAKNIVWQRGAGGGRLVLVDGLGHADYIPACDYVAPLARWKIRRRWMRFAQTALQTCAGNSMLQRKLHDVFVACALALRATV